MSVDDFSPTTRAFWDAPDDEAARRYLSDHPKARTLAALMNLYLLLVEANRSGDERSARVAAQRLSILAEPTEEHLIVAAVQLEHQAASFGTGVADDFVLERALALLDRTDSEELASGLHHDLAPQVYNSMAIVKGSCAQLAGRLDLIDSGQADIERAVELTGEDDEAYPGRLNNLANYYAMSFEQSRERTLLERAVVASRRCVELTPPHHEAALDHLTGLAVRLQQLHAETGSRSALLEAVELTTSAVRRTSRDDPAYRRRAALLSELRQQAM